MKIKIILCFSILISFTSCVVHENVIGKYHSNLASLGFFITEIELKSDNTFRYKFSGDLQHIELDGIYKIKKNKLYLRFNKLTGEVDDDAIKIVGKDTLVDFVKLMNSHSYELKKEDEIEYHLKYKILKEKLQVYHIQTNKLVKNSKVYSEKGNWQLKKYFLKKIEK